jgi:hypothetical protein
VKTTSGATAVQIVHSSRRGSRDIEYIGSAHDEVELELLKAAAWQHLAGGQGELDLGLERTGPATRATGGGPLPITSTRMSNLLDSWSVPTGCWGSGTPPAGMRCLPSWCWPGSSSR